ncbi:MAG: hypothetical protein M3P18_09280 [Actinomycetota bacterium]|nr:hypothetical protein [Actinomycetota bacterium]
MPPAIAASLLADTATLAVAVVGLCLAVLSLAWNVVSFVLSRRAKLVPEITATVQIFEPENRAVLTFVNMGEGTARHLLFLGRFGRNYSQGPVENGVLIPHAVKTAEPEFATPVTGEDDEPLIWTYMDGRGHIYARGNDGQRVRFHAKGGRRELGAIFAELYPQEADLAHAWSSRPSRWIGDKRATKGQQGLPRPAEIASRVLGFLRRIRLGRSRRT